MHKRQKSLWRKRLLFSFCLFFFPYFGCVECTCVGGGLCCLIFFANVIVSATRACVCSFVCECAKWASKYSFVTFVVEEFLQSNKHVHRSTIISLFPSLLCIRNVHLCTPNQLTFVAAVHFWDFGKFRCQINWWFFDGVKHKSWFVFRLPWASARLIESDRIPHIRSCQKWEIVFRCCPWPNLLSRATKHNRTPQKQFIFFLLRDASDELRSLHKPLFLILIDESICVCVRRAAVHPFKDTKQICEKYELCMMIERIVRIVAVVDITIRLRILHFVSFIQRIEYFFFQLHSSGNFRCSLFFYRYTWCALCICHAMAPLIKCKQQCTSLNSAQQRMRQIKGNVVVWRRLRHQRSVDERAIEGTRERWR